MKTILNWTAGSFFRSIGRIIAYVVIGGFIAYLLNRSNFDWGRLIGIEYVKASEMYSLYSNWYNANGIQLQQMGDYGYIQYTGTGQNTSWNYFYYNANQSATIINQNADYLMFSLDFSVMYSGMTSYSYSDTDSQTCTLTSSINQVGTDDYEYRYISFTCPINTTETETYTQQMQVALNPRLVYGNNQWSKCEFDTCLGTTCSLKCNLDTSFKVSGFKGIGVNVNTYNFNSQSGSYTWRLSLARPFNGYVSVQSAIESQTQQQQQQYNDTNSTSESNTATSYFENQQDETPSALTSAITSPLRIIDNAIQGNHNPLCFTLNGKQACIPSGDIIWGGNTGSNNYHHRQ